MILGINAHQANKDHLRLAASIGAQFVRVDANWYDLEKSQGQYTPEWLDDFIANATELGMQVYATLSYTPPWISPNRNTPPPMAEWKRFVQLFGERYAGKLQYVSIWNEPNISGMYNGSVQQYIETTLGPASEALREIGAGYQICGPDLSTQGSWRPWLQELITHAASQIDVLTVHAYGTPGREVRNKLRDVREVMRIAGALNLPLALTEFGWNTARISEAAQANYLDQFLEAAPEWLIAALYFNLINESTAVQWGLFRDNGTPKPAASVFQRYAQ